MLNDKKNVAIDSFSSGKFINIRKYACVKDLTNIMSENEDEDMIVDVLVQKLDFCREENTIGRKKETTSERIKETTTARITENTTKRNQDKTTEKAKKITT